MECRIVDVVQFLLGQQWSMQESCLVVVFWLGASVDLGEVGVEVEQVVVVGDPVQGWNLW